MLAAMNLINKKYLRMVLAGIFVLLVFSVSAFAKEHVWEVTDGVYRYGNPNLGYFSMFVVTDDGVAVIEPMSTQHSENMLKAIREITKQPIRYLLHSHNHWDHSKGGKVFRDQGAKIVAHKDAVKWMKSNPHKELAIPDVVWKGKRKTVKLGGKRIELHHLGLNHGLGMTAFLLPKDKVIYIADLVTPNRMPFSIADFNIRALTQTLTQVEKMNFTKAVFSHSHAKKPFGTKTDLVQTREFFKDLQAEIIAEFKKGTSFYQMPQKLKLPKYKSWDFYDEWLPMNVWNMMFQMEMGSFPWRAVKK